MALRYSKTSSPTTFFSIFLCYVSFAHKSNHIVLETLEVKTSQNLMYSAWPWNYEQRWFISVNLTTYAIVSTGEMLPKLLTSSLFKISCWCRLCFKTPDGIWTTSCIKEIWVLSVLMLHMSIITDMHRLTKEKKLPIVLLNLRYLGFWEYESSLLFFCHFRK